MFIVADLVSLSFKHNIYTERNFQTATRHFLIYLNIYDTRGVQYIMKTAQYIPKFYIYTLHNYFQ